MAFKTNMLLALLLLVVALGTTATETTSAQSHGEGSCEYADAIPTAGNQSQIQDATLCLVNRERTERGRAELRRNGTLERVAGRYSKRMVEDRFFDHVAPGGATLTDRVERTNYLDGSLKRWALGENIAWGSGRLGTARSIVKSWMNSSGHRRNILDPRFREAGFGIVPGVPDPRVSGPAATYTNVFGQRVRR